MHQPALGQVVRNCVVLGDAVIPEGYIIDLPLPAQNEFRAPPVRIKKREQRLALARTEFVNAGGKALVDKQRLAS